VHELLSVLAVTGVPVLAVLWVSLRYGPQVLRALLALVAGITAIVSRNDKRVESCHRVLDKVTRRDNGPPGPRRREIGRGRSGRSDG
jgi:hypothetical protein